MSKINTVLGSITADQMGPTLMHEHMVLAYPGWDKDALREHIELNDLAKIVADSLGTVKEYGIKTVIDATPNDLNRDVDLIKLVSEKTGLNIICSTGMYMEEEGMPAYIKFRSQVHDTLTELYETFVQEITFGIGKSGVKAGVIKVATGNGHISPYEDRVLKAAAKAQKETGVPLITHTQQGTMGPEQAALLTGEGVDPAKIVIGHMCGNANLQYQMAVLDKGVCVGFDRWGINFLFPDNLRKATLLGLLGLGFADRVVLSHDFSAKWLGRPYNLPDFVVQMIADWSYTHLFKNIIPQLKQAGITDEQIGLMMVENPRRIFGG
ncbi:MAG: phosphotriesterase family protein [Dehalococcoidia bacterium]